MLQVSRISKLVNAFSIYKGRKRRVEVPRVKEILDLDQRLVQIEGTLLQKQITTLTPPSGRSFHVTKKNPGKYDVNKDDGDLHFCLGSQQQGPYLVCELQGARKGNWEKRFNDARGSTIKVEGFFRGLFEHPGFRSNDDAHIFEIHPVTAVTIGGKSYRFPIGRPDQKSIWPWKRKKVDLSVDDKKVGVRYDRGKDTLIFSGMGVQTENYVKVTGEVSKKKMATKKNPATFILTSKKEVGYPLNVLVFPRTTAYKQLAGLKSKSVTMIGLRNIDIRSATRPRGKYEINLLAVDIKKN